MKGFILACLCLAAVVPANSIIRPGGDEVVVAYRICRQHGEVPTFDSSGRVQRCVWTNPPCRGFRVECRWDFSGRDYICCGPPYAPHRY